MIMIKDFERDYDAHDKKSITIIVVTMMTVKIMIMFKMVRMMTTVTRSHVLRRQQ